MNRFDYNSSPNDGMIIIDAPLRVAFKILKTEKRWRGFWYGLHGQHFYPEPKREWEVHLIKVLSGNMEYPRKNISPESGEVWVGAKWIARRIRERGPQA